MSDRPTTIGAGARVLWRGDPAYESKRRAVLWTRRTPERYPEAIVSVAGEPDVVAALGLARGHALRVAVVSGGHSMCGSPLRDGSLLIDLSRLDAIAIDPPARTAVIQPAVRSLTLATALEEHGLAFPVGHHSTVAMGGFLLAGGFGWNAGRWGPACASVRAIDVVTADGEIVRADESHHSDLLWAARGGGAAFFGVVTRFHVALQALPRAIASSTYLYRAEDQGEIGAWAAKVVPQLPRELEVALLVAPPPARLRDRSASDPGQRQVVLVVNAFADTADQARTLLAAVESRPPLARCLASELREPTPFVTLFEHVAGFLPPAHRCASDALFSNADAGDLLLRLRDPLARAPSPKSHLLCVLPPPPDGEVRGGMALSAGGRTFLACYAVWSDPAEDGVHERWLRETMRKVEPVACGRYIGESDVFADAGHLRASFAPDSFDRLRGVRRAYDPQGVFATLPGLD